MPGWYVRTEAAPDNAAAGRVVSEAGWTVTLLGNFRLAMGAKPVVVRPSVQRLVALVGVLGPLDRVDVAQLLWLDRCDAQALGNLRTLLWHMRRETPQLVDEGGARLTIEGSVDLTQVVSWSERVLRGGDPGAALPSGIGRELLTGWSDEWLITRREEIRQVQLHALEAAARHALGTGRYADAWTRAWTAVSADPLRESAVRILIEIHLAEGNAAEAVRRYRHFREVLQRELETSPSPRLEALMRGRGWPQRPECRQRLNTDHLSTGEI